MELELREVADLLFLQLETPTPNCSNLALRPTEELIDNHLLVKWFVGYSLFETPPDHSYLNRFELWVFRHCPRLFFDEVIRLEE